jgi:hypothetical protein
MLVIVFSASMFLSAALLFLVEPMIAKMMLPMLGGTPAVWNTCLVFFQAMLLAGYLYAHAGMKWLGRKTQIILHGILALAPLVWIGLLPLHLPLGWEPPIQSSPVPWILAILLVSVGLPFFALASNTPIMQRWFADSGHPQAADPYFLYAASNAGSLAGLLIYPLLLEPRLRLSAQSRLWTYGYILFLAMTAACAILVWNRAAASTLVPDADCEEMAWNGIWRERLRWIALAFVPSSLMLGITAALTTDMPAIPLIWVLPLALYLISFVLVFCKRPPISHEWLIRRLPFLSLAALIPVISQTRFPLIVFLLLNLFLLLAVAMVCHGELARSRPRLRRLTEFYLWISVGGVLGGIFNSLIAPLVFHSVLEFPLVLIFAALLRPPIDVKPLTGPKAVWARRNDLLMPLALGACMLTVILGLAHMGIQPGRPLTILIFGYSAVWCLSFGKRPLRFAAGLGAMLLASSFYVGPFGRVLATERSFFGVLRVSNDFGGQYRILIHGATIHGIQSLDQARSREPLSYYSENGPAGQISRAAQAKLPNGNWAVVGLGAGTMACLVRPGQSLTYYEIDPLVARIAEDPRYFTFLEDCAPHAKIILGDARLKLKDAPDSHYGLIALDAFSGDTIPVHLVTREALGLYLRKLAPGGMIAFHISNLYLDLAPTLGDLAQDMRLACLIENDTNVSEEQMEMGRRPSRWIVMARDQADLAGLTTQSTSDARWLPIQERRGSTTWTDDYSNLLSVINWH